MSEFENKLCIAAVTVREAEMLDIPVTIGLLNFLSLSDAIFTSKVCV